MNPTAIIITNPKKELAELVIKQATPCSQVLYATDCTTAAWLVNDKVMATNNHKFGVISYTHTISIFLSGCFQEIGVLIIAWVSIPVYLSSTD